MNKLRILAVAWLGLAGPATFLAGCKDEIVVESRSGGALVDAKYRLHVDGHLSDREVAVTTADAARLAPGEGIFTDGKLYVAGAKGGALSIRDGKLVLKGMTERKLP